MTDFYFNIVVVMVNFNQSHAQVHGPENCLIQVSFECADSRSFFTILFSVGYLQLLTAMISPQLYSSLIRQGHGQQ